MMIRTAFVGFRHPHVFTMYQLLSQRDDVEIVAACEEDAAVRETLSASGIAVTHDSYAAMLADMSCDVVAVGDYFSVRGARAIQALERGCHVIGDKPICTTLSDWHQIRTISEARGLRVGCMLDLRDLGPYITLRALIGAGAIGEVHTVVFQGQHPLLYGKRPGWFFETGKHGGSLNDIAVHAVDIIPWLTGRRIVEITAARAWNARLPQHPTFQDGAMLMLRLDNNGGVLGDLSYLSSDRHGYQMAPYWRFTLSGSEGVAETCCNAAGVTIWRSDTGDVLEEPVAPNRTGGFFEDFLADVAGHPSADGLDTARVLAHTRMALLAQEAAETGVFPVCLENLG